MDRIRRRAFVFGDGKQLNMDDPNIIPLRKPKKQPSGSNLNELAPWVVVGLVFGTLAGVAYTFHTNPFRANLETIDPTGIMRGGIAECGLIRRTCIVDGDTGWQDGRKWRLTAIDAPELSNSECPRERELGQQSTTRLIELMTNGYRIVWSGRDDRYGRALVDVQLADGRDAGAVLISEGLAQPWPNTGNIWCER